MVLGNLESEIYGTKLKCINTKQALFPTVGPFLHSFYKLSCSRPFDAGMKDKIPPPPGVQNPLSFMLQNKHYPKG